MEIGKLTQIYQIRFYPESGGRFSPVDFIQSLTNTNEVAVIKRQLETISCFYPQYWGQYGKIEKVVKDLYQITAGNHRLYCLIDGEYIVVVFICRKVGRKARRQDLDRAVINQRRYLDED